MAAQISVCRGVTGGLFWNCWLLGICGTCRKSCPIESWIDNSVRILDLELTHQCRWVATLESACNMKNKRAESRSKRCANNWETTRGRGPPKERSSGQRRPQWVIKKGVCNGVKFQRKIQKDKDWKASDSFYNYRSILFHLCRCSFSKVVEETSRM